MHEQEQPEGGAPGDRVGPCKHCGRGDLVWRRRGLCWRCHRNRARRAQFPPLCAGGPAIAMGRDLLEPLGPAPGPLPGNPGSPERVEALAARYGMRRELFSPDDRRPDVQMVRRVVKLFGADVPVRDVLILDVPHDAAAG